MLSLYDLLLGNVTAKLQATKEKINKLNFTEAKNFKKMFFCVSESNKKVKKHNTQNGKKYL